MFSSSSMTRSSALLVLSLLCTAHSKELAWNGQVLPGSAQPQPFWPFYLPPGARYCDSSSSSIKYVGHWHEISSKSCIEGSSWRTGERGAMASLSFVGTGIEWLGSVGPDHGTATVYIDGQRVQDVDAQSNHTYYRQLLFWSYDLDPGRHVVMVQSNPEGHHDTRQSIVDLDAFLVYNSLQDGYLPSATESSDVYGQFPQPNRWSLIQNGSTGVAAMQLTVISSTHAIIIDKIEHNPLSIDGHPAWAALYNFQGNGLTPLRMQSNSFCAGGTFLSNGTLINVGGNPVTPDFTSSADFGPLNGLQAIRLFEPCKSPDVSGCSIYENHARVRMASPRWYSTALRLCDGSAMIIGGSKKGGWINNATVNNPTIEFWPPKHTTGSNGLPIHLPFLVDTLNANLFPIAFLLPDGKVFMAANRDAMIYDMKTRIERRLPRIPNGVRVTYPFAGTAVLLPLRYDDWYAEILICGGSTIDDQKLSYKISSQDPASTQCSRLLLTEEGIAAGWITEQLPEPRVMPDAVLLPTGQVAILNGARTGISGYGNVINQIGQSNADNALFTPVLYDPSAPLGHRFSTPSIPPSHIPRVYHSCATLTPDGDIMVVGSNPNLDRSDTVYRTEYRVERYRPSYMTAERPKVYHAPDRVAFDGTFLLHVGMPSTLKKNSTVEGECWMKC